MHIGVHSFVPMACPGGRTATALPCASKIVWHILPNWPPQEAAPLLMKSFYLKTVMPTAPASGKLIGNKSRAAQARFFYYTTQQGGKYVIPKNTTLIIEKST